jgi:hypothetical protein
MLDLLDRLRKRTAANRQHRMSDSALAALDDRMDIGARRGQIIAMAELGFVPGPQRSARPRRF